MPNRRRAVAKQKKAAFFGGSGANALGKNVSRGGHARQVERERDDDIIRETIQRAKKSVK